MRSMLVALIIPPIAACSWACALAQDAKTAAEKPSAGSVENIDDAMTDVDPAVLARCKREAAQKKLKGAERATFMNACVEPED